MIMSIAPKAEQCHPQARFWLPTQNIDRLEFFMKLNKIEKVVDKKVFGILVASRIIHLRQ